MPTKSPARGTAETSNTFYAIFGREAEQYMDVDGHFFYADGPQDARQFSSIADLLTFVNEEDPDMGQLEIRRVTRTITPGVTSRRVLDHGEAAPAGAEIKFAVVNLYTAKRNLQESPTTYGAASTSKDAQLFADEIAANNARKFSSDPGWGIRRVALIATDAKVEYKEEVVQ